MAKILLAVELNDNECIDEVIKKIATKEIDQFHTASDSKFNDGETLLAVSDVMKYLSIGSTSAYELFKRSDFPCFKINGRYTVRKDKFLEFVESCYGKKNRIK